MDGFLREFVTPILKAVKGNEEKAFFTIPEFESWAEGRNLKPWKIKYYKGLGTSSAKEAKEYFAEIAYHTVDFQYLD
jgi:DNA topoisomerase II